MSDRFALTRPWLTTLALASLFALVPDQVRANWQFTEWGMTPEAVGAASPGPLVDASQESGMGPEATLVTQAGQKALLRGKWTSGEFQFTTYFLFDTARKLASVKLLLSDHTQAEELSAALAQKYGKPEKEFHGIVDSISWRTEDETISFLGPLDATTPCTVIYVSAKSSANEGL